MNLLTRFNAWLNSVKEPQRFLIVVLMMYAWLCPLQIGILLEIANLVIFGIIGLVITILVALNRIGNFTR